MFSSVEKWIDYLDKMLKTMREWRKTHENQP